jgi:hypothetical protein
LPFFNSDLALRYTKSEARPSNDQKRRYLGWRREGEEEGRERRDKGEEGREGRGRNKGEKGGTRDRRGGGREGRERRERKIILNF